MNIKRFFHRKRSVPVGSADRKPQPLRIEGIGPAPLTPEPDEAELAAQALLEHMIEVSSAKFFDERSGRAERKVQSSNKNADKTAAANLEPGTLRSTSGRLLPTGRKNLEPIRDAKYYRDLAARIRSAHEAATQRTLRFVAFCEQELQKPSLPLSGPGSLGLLETELYKRLDVIERRGGELKKRWQHCLATVIVRRMQAEEQPPTDETPTDDTDPSDSK